jgi:hypothetical protein
MTELIAAIAGAAGLAKSIVDLIRAGKETNAGRAARNAEADRAFKELRFEVDKNLALLNGLRPGAFDGLAVNDTQVKAFVSKLSSAAIETVYFLSSRYIVKKPAKTAAFIKALFYTKRKIDDLQRLASLSSAELAATRPPRISVRLNNLRDYLNALRKTL